MKELTFEEFKQVGIDLLKIVDRFCRENYANYSRCYGTLIGAIRHKGFIPWDDDIDIVMPRRDYDKFVKTFNECIL